MSRQRIAFTEAQLLHLNNAYENGLNSLKKKEAIDNLAQQMGISSIRIKNWIGNRRKRDLTAKTSKPYIREKSGLKKPTSFNLFCRGQSIGDSAQNSFKDWAKKWQDISQDEKDHFKEKAKEEQMNPTITETDIPIIIKRQMNRISDACDILNSVGMEVGGLAIGNSGQISVFGSAQGAKFFSTPEMREKFFNAITGSSETIEKENRELLRTKIRQIYRRLWEKVIGRSQMVPYKDIKTGKINLEVTGLPSGICFKDPSSYGQKAMMDILKCNDLDFKIRDQQLQETENAQLQSEEVNHRLDERNEQETGTLVVPCTEAINADERAEQQIYSPQPVNHENVDVTSEERNEQETGTLVPCTEAINADERNEQETGTLVPCTEAINADERNEQETSTIVPCIETIDSNESPSVSKRKKTESADSALSNGKFRFTKLKRQRSRRGKKEILVEWTDGSSTWEPEKNIPALFRKQFFGN